MALHGGGVGGGSGESGKFPTAQQQILAAQAGADTKTGLKMKFCVLRSEHITQQSCTTAIPESVLPRQPDGADGGKQSGLLEVDS